MKISHFFTSSPGILTSLACFGALSCIIPKRLIPKGFGGAVPKALVTLAFSGGVNMFCSRNIRKKQDELHNEDKLIELSKTEATQLYWNRMADYKASLNIIVFPIIKRIRELRHSFEIIGPDERNMLDWLAEKHTQDKITHPENNKKNYKISEIQDPQFQETHRGDYSVASANFTEAILSEAHHTLSESRFLFHTPNQTPQINEQKAWETYKKYLHKFCFLEGQDSPVSREMTPNDRYQMEIWKYVPHLSPELRRQEEELQRQQPQ